jgi:hypothetical protein
MKLKHMDDTVVRLDRVIMIGSIVPGRRPASAACSYRVPTKSVTNTLKVPRPGSPGTKGLVWYLVLKPFILSVGLVSRSDMPTLRARITGSFKLKPLLRQPPGGSCSLTALCYGPRSALSCMHSPRYSYVRYLPQGHAPLGPVY